MLNLKDEQNHPEASKEDIFAWIEHPESARFLAGNEGSIIFKDFHFQEFVEGGFSLPRLYEAGILQHLRGLESDTFQDFEEVIKMPNFDINDLPWYDMDLQVLKQVMKKATKPIIINQGNDHLLTEDLINFATQTSLWMAVKVDPSENAQDLVSFSALLESVQLSLGEMDINSQVFFQLSTHGHVSMGQVELAYANFDINNIT